jgi:hypothetical protein
MRRVAVTLALAAALTAGAAQAAPVCAPAGAAKDVEAVVRGWFSAFERNDYPAGLALQTPGFYAYDNGHRLDGAALGDLLRTAKAAGFKVEWNIGPVDVHPGCDEAWAAWVNKGSAGASGAVEPVTWLESAGLRYLDGHWRMEFLNSSRVPPPNQAPAAEPGRRRQRG